MRAMGYRRMGIVKSGQSAQVYTFAPIRANEQASDFRPATEPEALRA